MGKSSANLFTGTTVGSDAGARRKSPRIEASVGAIVKVVNSDCSGRPQESRSYSFRPLEALPLGARTSKMALMGMLELHIALCFSLTREVPVRRVTSVVEWK